MLKFPAFLTLLTVSSLASAQDADAFLACADITDRVERVICLEDALEAATAGQEEEAASVTEAPRTEVEDFGTTPTVNEAVAETAVVTESEPEERRSFFRLPRLPNLFGGNDDEPDTETVDVEPVEEDAVESFGREARVVVNNEGVDELQDEIAELSRSSSGMWTIRLVSGQVWQQTHPRRLNLREGDAVSIYPSRWGDSYRLETSRLNGYIQVQRAE